MARHRPAPAGEPDWLNPAGSERLAASGSTSAEAEVGRNARVRPAGRRHSAGAVSWLLRRPGTVAPPTGAKWYGPRGRGPGHVTRQRPPFCSAVLVFRAQRLTGGSPSQPSDCSPHARHPPPARTPAARPPPARPPRSARPRPRLGQLSSLPPHRRYVGDQERTRVRLIFRSHGRLGRHGL